MKNKGGRAICMHKRDSKRKIDVVLFDFRGLRPHTLWDRANGAPPLNQTPNPLKFAPNFFFLGRHCLYHSIATFSYLARFTISRTHNLHRHKSILITQCFDFSLNTNYSCM